MKEVLSNCLVKVATKSPYNMASKGFAYLGKEGKPLGEFSECFNNIFKDDEAEMNN